MSHIENIAKSAQSKSDVSPCANITKVHAIVIRIFGEMQDCFTNEHDMCQVTFGEQCALVKTLVDCYMLDFQHALCKAVDERAKKLRSKDRDAKPIDGEVLHKVLLDDVFFDVVSNLLVPHDRCHIRPLISELSTCT